MIEKAGPELVEESGRLPADAATQLVKQRFLDGLIPHLKDKLFTERPEAENISTKDLLPIFSP